MLFRSDTDFNDDVKKYKSVKKPWVLIKGDQGIPGNDGHTPNISIGANGNWLIDGNDSGKKAQGNDGHTPIVTIGTDGYWYIDNVKTSQKAQGEKGADGTQYRNVEKYAYGDSNTTPPTGGWSDSISGGTAGKYLWNQETAQSKAATDTHWVDVGKPTTHCIGYIAKNGENGANFTGVLEHYMATTDGTKAPDTNKGSWQPTPTAAG